MNSWPSLEDILAEDTHVWWQCPTCSTAYDVKHTANRDKLIAKNQVCTKCTKDGWWVSMEGPIHLSKVDDNHLENIYKLLIRRAKKTYGDSITAAYSMAGFLQGEMAQVAIWEDIDMMEDYMDYTDVLDTYPIWIPVCKEMEKRGLCK